jgi:hypothetical protein
LDVARRRGPVGESENDPGDVRGSRERDRQWRRTGAACTKDSDCGSACVYVIADKCAAVATCQKLRTGPSCASLTLQCVHVNGGIVKR